MVKGFLERVEPGLVPAFAGRLVLLVALAAVDRPSLSWLERNSGLRSTIGALRWVHLTRLIAPISASSVVHYDYLLVGSTDLGSVYAFSNSLSGIKKHPRIKHLTIPGAQSLDQLDNMP